MLSPHFSLHEFTRSQIATRRGLDNTPDAEITENLKQTAAGMEEVRELLGHVPIYIQSGYRSLRINAAVGGALTSQHCKGEAADFVAPQFGTPLEICRAIKESDIQFDQLIAEGVDDGGGWIHISFSDRTRRSVLTARFVNGKAQYSQGIS